MRRGFSLEHQVQKLCDAVNNQGGFAQKNHPHRTVDGLYLEGEGFDWLFLTDWYKAAFDTKECTVKYWNLSNAKLKQVAALKRCKNTGLDAFFLVYFYPSKKLVKFDVDLVMQTDKKSLSAEDGVIWDYKILFKQ